MVGGKILKTFADVTTYCEWSSHPFIEHLS